jgi:nucleoside-diphosphate-sugar epimerase
MDRPLAALTGATGFLGRHVAEQLHAAGWRLRVLARPEAVAQTIRSLDPEVVSGRLSDEAALARLVEGAGAVIHNAGLIKARTSAEFIAVNLEGSLALARAAQQRAPKAHFIMVSSLSARAPQLSAYGSSKAAAEDAVRQVLAPERLTIVRPPAVYGPGDLETLALFQAAQSLPLLPRVGSDRARFALVHAADAAAQIAALAARPGEGRTYALADGRPEGYRWREVLEAAAAAVGRRLPVAPVPGGLVLAVGAANSLMVRLGAEARILGLGKARELLHPDWGLSASELDSQRPQARFDLCDGFADAVGWYRAMGWLKGQAPPSGRPES